MTDVRQPVGARATVPWTPVSVVMIGMFMAILDSYIVVVAGPAIRADLGASEGQLQWILAGYQLSYAVLMITGGRFADMYGRKRIFLLGAVVFTLSSIVCAAAQSPGPLIAARVVQGLGAALMVPQVFAMIAVLVPEHARHRVFGVLGVVIGLATIGGQLIGGLLIGADLFGSQWRGVFWVNVPIGVLTILLAVKYVPESRVAAARKLDVPGVLALSAALLLLTFPLIQGREAGWPWWTFACFAASAVAFAVFVAAERAVDRAGGEPLVRLALFGQRSFAVGIVLVLCVYAFLTSYYLALSISMQDGLGLSALGSGLVYAPAATTFFVFSMVAGRLVPKYGRRVLEVGAIVVASGYLAMAVVLSCGPEISAALVIPILMWQSVGGGLLITPMLNTVLSGVDPASVGTASGALSTAQQVGGALGVAVIGAVFFAAFRPETDGAAAAAGHAFAMSSVATFLLATVATVLVFLLPVRAK
ncbi:EmrB/QacA subfamily drug resistance transporter [Nocardia tenerifensis]|uniref:EmrB/QacA subfamily drug resistance transporter n=1 Tax=Nocardia tenerifensis TaxID=228006 RepID=A0A318K7U3_9NOCA|nr:MFS transporter [Nocardia tenerifensis]PXX59858.1 EmrB/QacA subfamily drug resistance transporter [Nocardia tenerifensis]